MLRGSVSMPCAAGNGVPVMNSEVALSPGRLTSARDIRSYNLPAASGQRPAASGQRPAASGQRPAASGQRPAASGQRHEVRPAGGRPA